MGNPPEALLQEQPENSKRTRHAVPSKLSVSRVKRVLAQGPVKDWEDFWSRYTATSRGLTAERVNAVQEFQRDGDRTKLKKVLGTKSDATMFKTIGQVTDFLKRHGTPSPMVDYAKRVHRESIPTVIPEVVEELLPLLDRLRP